jgi:hypothetical protein
MGDEVPFDKLDKFLTGQNVIHPAKSITVYNGDHYSLLSQYLTGPTDGQDAPKAVICQKCKESVKKSKFIHIMILLRNLIEVTAESIPPRSIKAGIDFGSLPSFLSDLGNLTLLEELLLQRVRIFHHVIKIQANKDRYALKGHVIATPTDAFFKSRIEIEKLQRLPQNINIDQIGLVVSFVGKHDHYLRLFKTETGRIQLIRTYRNMLEINSVRLRRWIAFLGEYGPNWCRTYFEGSDTLSDNHLTQLPHRILENAVHLATVTDEVLEAATATIPGTVPNAVPLDDGFNDCSTGSSADTPQGSLLPLLVLPPLTEIEKDSSSFFKGVKRAFEKIQNGGFSERCVVNKVMFSRIVNSMI